MDYYKSKNNNIEGDLRDLIQHKKVSITLFDWTLEFLIEKLKKRLDDLYGKKQYTLYVDGKDENRVEASYLFTFSERALSNTNKENKIFLESDY